MANIDIDNPQNINLHEQAVLAKVGNFIIEELLQFLPNYEAVIPLLDEYRIIVHNIANAPDAVKVANFSEIEILNQVLKRLNIDILNESQKHLLFVQAVKTNNLEAVNLLLKHNTNVNILTKDGIAVLNIAIKNEYKEIIDILVDHPSANINIIDTNNKSPLLYAINNNVSNEIIIKLLSHPKINIDITDKKGNAPLHLVTKKNNVDLIKLLVEKDADVNIQNSDGNTPLHIAAKNNNIKIFKLLSPKGYIALASKNKDGFMLLELAKNSPVKKAMAEEIEQVKQQVQDNLDEALTDILDTPRCKRDLGDQGHNIVKRGAPSCNNIDYKVTHDGNMLSQDYLNMALLYNHNKYGNINKSLKYIKNFNSLLNEKAINIGYEEKHKLKVHHRKAIKANEKYHDQILVKYTSSEFPTDNAFLYTNKKTSILVIKDKSGYTLYGYHINYSHKFSLRDDISFQKLNKAVAKIFTALSNSPEYEIYVASPTLPKTKTIRALELHPNAIASDYTLLSKGKIPGRKKVSSTGELTLSNRALTDKDIEQFVKIPELQHVKKLDLSHNNIGDEGLKYILNTKNLPNLKELKISDNFLHLTHTEKYNLQSIDKIDLQYNNIPTKAISTINKKYPGTDLVLDNYYPGASQDSKNYNGHNKYIENVYIRGMEAHMDTTNIRAPLKNKILSAAGKLHMMYGLYGIKVSCTQGEAKDCVYNLASFGYQFLSGPIENMSIKMTTYLVNNGMSKVPKLGSIKGINIEFIAKVSAGKYAIKFAKAAGGVAVGLFDIIDLAKASVKLHQCNTTHQCTDKEIRDAIAEISFASVSLVSGVLVAAYGTGPIGIIVGTALFVGYSVYNGVSNIIEYEEKYDTTHSENWSIFWRTVTMNEMSADVQELAYRTEYVNSLTKAAITNLESMPENVVGYAYGLGELKTSYTPYTAPCGSPPVNVVCTKYKTEIEFHSGYSKIDMNNNYTNYKLSRVLPKANKDISFICLPKKTDAEYEVVDREGHSNYYCENSAVVVNQTRINQKSSNPTIVYDPTYMEYSEIIGSNIYDNTYYLYQNSESIYGSANTRNEFIFNNIDFQGKILLNSNSTNVINTANLKNQIILLEFEELKEKGQKVKIGFHNNHPISVESSHKTRSIAYQGSNKNSDIVQCKASDEVIKNPSQNSFFISTGGGINNSKPDKLFNCTNAIISPHTIASGLKEDNYNFYIKTTDYNIDDNSISSIGARGNVTITFIDNVLLKDCKQILYYPNNDTLSIEMPLGNTGKVHTINIASYLNAKVNNVILFDKYGSNIVPTIPKDTNVVSEFGIYIQFSARNLTNFQNYYKKFSEAKPEYNVYTILQGNFSEVMQGAFFGASSVDIIMLDNNIIYGQGNNGSDIYQIDHLNNQVDVDINNFAEDLAFDVLYLPPHNNSYIYQSADHLRIILYFENEKKSITVENYYKSKEYQHLIFLDEEYNSLIPFNYGGYIKLVPFYHANNIIVSPSTTTAVINAHRDDIFIYRYNNDSILEVNNSNIVILLKDLHNETPKWEDIKLYTYRDGIIDNYNPITVVQLQNSSRSPEKDIVIKNKLNVHYVSFRENIELNPNLHLLKNKMVPAGEKKEKIEIVVFNDIYPKDIDIIRSNKNIKLIHQKSGYSCIIHNPYKNTVNNDINIFEFRFSQLEKSILVYNSIKSSYNLAEKFTIVQAIYKSYQEISKLGKSQDCYDEHTLKCVLAYKKVEQPEYYHNVSHALGFNSITDYMDYVKECNFQSDKLNVLKNCINQPLLDQYKLILENTLKLNSYTEAEIDQFIQVINTDLISSSASQEIIETINKLLDIENLIQITQEHKLDLTTSETSDMELGGTVRNISYDFEI
ncbi:Ankyrin repeat protein [Rickettsiales bacterium Ac37b]|nr:Ankyrin repeat protein [Rickettsiales bacterium Ac37b]